MSEDVRIKLYDLATNKSVTPEERAQAMAYMIHEHGLDTVQPIAKLLKERDSATELVKELKDDEGVCVAHTFLGQRGPFTITAHGKTQYRSMQMTKHKAELGDIAYVSPKSGQIVCTEKNDYVRGEVATVADVYDDGVTVRTEGGHKQFMLVATDELLKAGDSVVCDEHNGVVYKKLGEGARKSLFSEVESYWLEPDEIGSLHEGFPALMTRLSGLAKHPTWANRLGIRPVTSYMFSGPTGTGKSFHARLLASELTRFCEDQYGERASRLVMVDANKFWSKWFGETEERIAEFFHDLNRELTEQSDNMKRVPIVVMVEEAEALFRSRDDGSSSHLFDRPLSLILQKMQSTTDSFSLPIMFLITTNRSDLIDAAARRRFGMRELAFSNFSSEQAADVLNVKMRPILNGGSSAFVREVIETVYDSVKAAIAITQDRNEHDIFVHDFVTGAVLEEAASQSVDLAFERCINTGRFSNPKPMDAVASIVSQASMIARTLTARNVTSYVPHVAARIPGISKIVAP